MIFKFVIFRKNKEIIKSSFMGAPFGFVEYVSMYVCGKMSANDLSCWKVDHCHIRDTYSVKQKNI